MTKCIHLSFHLLMRMTLIPPESIITAKQEVKICQGHTKIRLCVTVITSMQNRIKYNLLNSSGLKLSNGGGGDSY